MTLVINIAVARRPVSRTGCGSFAGSRPQRFYPAFFTTLDCTLYFLCELLAMALSADEIAAPRAAQRNIQAGYETNGWTGYDLILAHAPPSNCIGPCSCTDGWFCLDDSYRIGMNVYGNYEVIASRRPSYWLANGPPIYVSRRKMR